MKPKRFFVVFAIFLLVCSNFPIFSQESESTETVDESWYYGKPIKSVSFKGLENTDSKDVDGIYSGFIGKPFSDEIYQDILDRIYSLDIFEDIEPRVRPGDSRKATVSLEFVVTEKPTVRRIVVTGNRKLRSTEIKDKLSMKPKDIYVATKLPSEERAIRAFYIEKGFSNVKVSSSTNKTEKGIDITFKIEEGRETVVTNVLVQGNSVLSSKNLKKRLKTKETGKFSKAPFQESMLESDKQTIILYYNSLGYIDASVVDVKKEIVPNVKKDRDELSITFFVEEGNCYTYSGIMFNGNEIFSDEKLHELVKIKDGAVLNQIKLQESLTAITDLYYENGYTSNNFNLVPSKNDETKSVFYTLNIVEKARSHIESILIKGNSKTQEHVITREIPFESGDIFSKEKLNVALRNLYNLQYFSAVVPNILPGSEENLIDLVFTVDEQPTTSIEFGVTFSGVSDPNDLPFALFAKWQDSNVKGSGKSLSISSSIATDTQSLGVSIGDDWFLGKPLSASISTSFSHSNERALRLGIDSDGNIDDDSYYMDYEQWKWTLGLSFGKRWTPNWSIITLSGGINGSLKSNIYDSDLWLPVDTTVSDYANTWGWQNSLWTSFSVDDRDINYNPSKGWFASQRFTWYGLTPVETEYFLRTDTKLEGYLTLFDLKVTEDWNFKMVLAAYSGLSMLFPVPETGIGDTSKLYIDGMFNGRGWTSIYNTVKGKLMWNNSLELRLPIVARVIALDWFVDAAVVYDEPYKLSSGLDKTDFFISTGPGVRFTIPQLPLRLLFANTGKFGAENDRWVEPDGKFHWKDNWKFVLSFNITNK